MKTHLMQNGQCYYPVCFTIYISTLVVIFSNTYKVYKLLKYPNSEAEDLTLSDIILTIICGVSLPCGLYFQAMMENSCSALGAGVNFLLAVGFIGFALFVILLGFLVNRNYSKV